MKLNIEELAKQAGFRSRDGHTRVQHSNGSFVVVDGELESFARLIVERCAVTAKGAAESGWDGATIATIVRKLLEAE